MQDISNVAGQVSFRIWYLWRVEIPVECNCDYSLRDCCFEKVPGTCVLCACVVCQALDSFLCSMSENKIKTWLLKGEGHTLPTGDCINYEKGSIRADFKVPDVESGLFWIPAWEKRGGRIGTSFSKALGISLVICLGLLVPQSSVPCGLIKKIPEVCDMQWQEPLTSLQQETVWLVLVQGFIPMCHWTIKQGDGKN